MKKILIGILLAVLFPYLLSASTTTELIRMPQFQSLNPTSEISIQKAGGIFQLNFTLYSGWEKEYTAAKLRSELNQELAEAEIRYLSIATLTIVPGTNSGKVSFQLTANNTADQRVFTINSSTNYVQVRQFGPDPIVFRIENDEDTYIFPDASISITLSGSEQGRTYDLYDQNRKILSMPGTGEKITFYPSSNVGVFTIKTGTTSMSGAASFDWYFFFQEPVIIPDQHPTMIDKNGGRQLFHCLLTQWLDTDGLQKYFHQLNMDWDNKLKIGLYAWEDTFITIEIVSQPNFSFQPRTYSTLIPVNGNTNWSFTQPGNADIYKYNVSGVIHNKDYSLFDVRLSSSQQGLIYMLYRNDISQSWLDGTGSALVFKGLTIPGIYTIVAMTPDGLNRQTMTGRAVMQYTSIDKTSGINWITQYTYTDQSGQGFVADITYYNGLGYPAQSVSVEASPTKKSLVQPIAYDNMFWSKGKTYLPYAASDGNGLLKSDALVDQVNFYTNLYGEDVGLYASTYSLHSSHFQKRIIKTIKPGYNIDSDISCNYAYSVNADNEVFNLQVSGSSFSVGYYPKNTLGKITIKDEDKNTTDTFTDYKNRKILTRSLQLNAPSADTYYGYDAFDRLAWVISPEGSALLTDGASYSTDSDLVKKYGYYYKYDGRSNVVEKRLPGCDPVYMTYDSSDRLVGRSDVTLSSENGSKNRLWQLYTYDILGRLVKQEQKITDVAGTALTSPWLISAYHYDDYDDSFFDSGFEPVPDVVSASDKDMRVHGSKTHERLAVLDDVAGTSPNRYVTRTFYYDHKGRVIQVAEQDSEENITRTSTQYDFTGNMLISYEQCGSDIKRTDFAYDHRSRLIWESTTVNSSDPVITVYKYDELGRLNSKTTDGIMETMDYNLQGWLTSKSAHQDAEELFSMSLRYYNPQFGTTPSYTGNISEWSWRHGVKRNENAYAFNYDNLSRLVGTTPYLNGRLYDRFLETGMLYDNNGNLTSIIRSVDDLFDVYTYKYDGNQLTSTTTQLIFPNSPGYKPKPIETSGFSYDPNGNLVYDAEHSLSLSYNHLNLIEKVERGGATLAKYSYLSDGTKLSATDGDDNGLAYSGSLVYNKQGGNLILESAGFNGGRIIATNHGYDTRYFITDHLGSTRVVVNNAGDVLERNDYYPYGTRWEDQDCEISDNRYRYNGKEDQTFINLPYMDYGARMYNGTRWFNIDPLAERYYSVSPYAYCTGNPVRFIDPNGMEFTESAWGWVNRLIDDVNSKLNSNNEKIKKNQAELAAGGVSEKQSQKLNRKIDRLNKSNAALEAVTAEIGTLAASDQVYDVRVDGSMSSDSELAGGFVFNFSNGNADIILPSSYTGIGVFAHELKHAYQFETGELSSGYREDGAPFYDKHDEVAAYERGAMFGETQYGLHNLPDIYKNLPLGPINATNHPNIKCLWEFPARLQNMANNAKSAFRVNGVTHYYKKQ